MFSPSRQLEGDKQRPRTMETGLGPFRKKILETPLPFERKVLRREAFVSRKKPNLFYKDRVNIDWQHLGQYLTRNQQPCYRHLLTHCWLKAAHFTIIASKQQQQQRQQQPPFSILSPLFFSSESASKVGNKQREPKNELVLPTA